MLLQAIGRNGLLLALFALLATTAIALTWLNTEQRIAAQQRAAQAKALLEIIPKSRHDNELLDDVLPVLDSALLRVDADARIHVARKQGRPVAVILPVVAPDGYSGGIEMIVGVNANGSIAGVRVLQHRETPGLGDKVELRKSDWILGFDGRSMSRPQPAAWAVKKDRGAFDQFTGATITPRAVVAAVYRALQYHAAHREALFAVDDIDSQETPHG